MEELLARYILNDGQIRSLDLRVEYGSANSSSLRQASVEILTRKKLLNGKWEPCLLRIHLINVQKIVIYDDFDSPSYYSDVVFRR